MPAIVIWAMGAVGVAVAVKFVIKEARRVNAELDEVRAAAARAQAGLARWPTLRRDPTSGEYWVP